MPILFTGKGDDGTTGYLGDGRISKADARIEAIGSVDELNSFLGNAKCLIEDKSIYSMIETVQRDLYLIMAEMANLSGSKIQNAELSEGRVSFLEKMLEEIGSQTEMPKGFILPGETQQAASFDICRSVARRAERRAVELNELSAIGNPEILRYLNRLSSLLFILEVKLSKKDDLQKFKYTKAA